MTGITFAFLKSAFPRLALRVSLFDADYFHLYGGEPDLFVEGLASFAVLTAERFAVVMYGIADLGFIAERQIEAARFIMRIVDERDIFVPSSSLKKPSTPAAPAG